MRQPIARREFDAPGDPRATFAAARAAAQRLGWSVAADGAAGGLVVIVPRDLRRARLAGSAHLFFTGGGSTRVLAHCCLRGIPLMRRAQAREILAVLEDAIADGGAGRALAVGAWSMQHAIVRSLVFTAAAVALAAAIILHPVTPLPAVALRQPLVYRLEVGLAVFYGALLLVTPMFFGLVRGRLPIEVSARGAKFAEEVAEDVETSIAASRQSVDDLRRSIEAATTKLTRARLNIDQLAEHLGVGFDD